MSNNLKLSGKQLKLLAASKQGSSAVMHFLQNYAKTRTTLSAEEECDMLTRFAYSLYTASDWDSYDKLLIKEILSEATLTIDTVNASMIQIFSTLPHSIIQS